MKKYEVLDSLNYEHNFKKRKAAFKAAGFQTCAMYTTAKSKSVSIVHRKGKTYITVSCFYRIPNIEFLTELNEKGRGYEKPMSPLWSSDYLTNTG